MHETGPAPLPAWHEDQPDVGLLSGPESDDPTGWVQPAEGGVSDQEQRHQSGANCVQHHPPGRGPERGLHREHERPAVGPVAIGDGQLKSALGSTERPATLGPERLARSNTPAAALPLSTATPCRTADDRIQWRPSLEPNRVSGGRRRPTGRKSTALDSRSVQPAQAPGSSVHHALQSESPAHRPADGRSSTPSAHGNCLQVLVDCRSTCRSQSAGDQEQENAVQARPAAARQAPPIAANNSSMTTGP